MSTSSIMQLETSLRKLSQVSVNGDVTARASIVSAALGDDQGLEFLSILYDVAVAAVAKLDKDASAAQLCSTCAAAALQYLPGKKASIMQQFIESFFLPFLASTSLPNPAIYLQVSTGMCKLLESQGCWSYLHQLMQRAVDSLQAHIKASGCPDAAAKQPSIEQVPVTSRDANKPAGHEQQQQQQQRLPLHVCSCLVPSILAACCRATADQEEPTLAGAAAAGSSTSSPQQVLTLSIQQMLPLALQMLSSEHAALRKAALKSILPPVMAAKQQGTHAWATALHALWQHCLDMLPSPGHQRRIALAVLVQYSAALKDPASNLDVLGCREFWRLLRECLSLEEPLDRKRAVYLLQSLLPAAQLQQPQWVVWLGLHSVLEEFAGHLIKAMLPQISCLHAIAPEYATTEAVLHPSAPKPKVKRRKAKAAGAAAGQEQPPTADTDTAATIAAAAAAAVDGTAADGAATSSTVDGGGSSSSSTCLGVEWICVLWQRALQHPNVQVQKLALRAFLQRDWSTAEAQDAAHGSSSGSGSSGCSRRAQEVPLEFMTQVLLPALVRDVHYKNAVADFDVQAAATAWLKLWLAGADGCGQRHLCCALLSTLMAKDVSRQGVQYALPAFAAAVGSAGKLHEDACPDGWSRSMVTELMACRQRLYFYQGTQFRLEGYRHLLHMAAVLAPPSRCDITDTARLMADLPAAATAVHGDLNAETRSWLLGRGSACTTTDSVQAQVAAWVSTLSAEYWANAPEGRHPTREEVQEWQAQATLVSRLLLVFADVPQVTSAPAVRCAQAVQQLYRRPYLTPGAVELALVMYEAMLAAATLPELYTASPLPLLQEVSTSLVVPTLDDLTMYATHALDAALSMAALSMAATGTGHTDTSNGLQDAASAAPSLGDVISSALRASNSVAGVAVSLIYVARNRSSISGHAAVQSRLVDAMASMLSKVAAGSLLQQCATAAGPAADTWQEVCVRLLQAIRSICDSIGHVAPLDPKLVSEFSARCSLQPVLFVVLQCEQAQLAQTTTAGVAPLARSGRNNKLNTERWSCIDAMLSAAPHMVAAAAAGSTPQPKGSLSSGSGTQQPPIIEPAACQKLLLSALLHLPTCYEDDMVPVLRCLRRCWSQTIADKDGKLQAAVATDLLRLGVAEAPSGQTPLTTIAWTVQRKLSAAMARCNKRKAAVCAAFVNTMVMPQLFLFKDDDDNNISLRSMHGAEGPLSWGFNRLLDWGATSPRVTLLLSCQLSSLLIEQPLLVHLYADQIQRILLFGSGKADAGYSLDVNVEEASHAEEVAAVLSPPDPQLLATHAATDAAPRVVLLCGLYELACKAGAFNNSHADGMVANAQTHQKKQQQPSAAAAAAAVTAATAVPVMAVPASSSHQQDGSCNAAQAAPSIASSSPKRPIIIFHDPSTWNDSIPMHPSPTFPQQQTAAAATHPFSPCQGPAETSSTVAGAAAAGSQLRMQVQQQVACPQPVHQAGNQHPSSNGLGGGHSNGTCSAQATSSQEQAAPASLQPLTGGSSSSAGNGSSGALRRGAVPVLHGDSGRPAAGPAYDASSAAATVGRDLFHQLLEYALTHPLISSDKYKIGTDLHRQKVRLWQALSVLATFVHPPFVEPAAQRIIGNFGSNNPPSVKQYQETTVAVLLLKQPELVEKLLLPMLTTYTKHHAGVGSCILLAAQVAMHVPAAWQQRLLPALLLAISPWLTCHTHNVRTFAQLIVHSLLVKYPMDAPLWQHSAADMTYLRQLNMFFDTNHDMLRLRRTIGAPILTWQSQCLSHPARVFSGTTSLAGSPPENVYFEGAPPALADRIQTFLVLERFRLREEQAHAFMEMEYLPDSLDPTTAAATAAAVAAAGSSSDLLEQRKEAASLDFQRKILPSDAGALIMGGSISSGNSSSAPHAGAALACLDGAEGLWGSLLLSGLVELLEVAAGEGTGGQATPGSQQEGIRSAIRSVGARQDIIVVASLIDKLPNLAGLARTCEVFRAALLVLPDLSMLREPSFASISVTAEQWVPITEVKPSALLPWLEKKQAEGYALLGLEQTAESCKLPEFQFPKRCVLLLGHEKEGLPAEVLLMLDATVEIPQLGIIRSLNVHVSGAIAVYEYTRQQLANKSQAAAQG